MATSNKPNYASQWKPADVDDLLSERTKNIGKGNDTDAGRMWRLPTDHPDPIVLAGGIPDDTVLPTGHLIHGITSAIENHADDALNYGGWFGYEKCRNAIAMRQNQIEGTSLNANNIIMHNGSSGCLENILKAFVEPGDVALVESPSYSGTVRAILGYQAEVVEVPMRKNGIDLDIFQSTINEIRLQGKRIKLFYTIPDFHNTPKRLRAFESALATDAVGRAAAVPDEIQFAKDRSREAGMVMERMAQGRVPERIVHNDTKFNNVLFHEKTEEPICVIDLDTVMPGSVLFDFGDMVRTATSPTEEDERDLSLVRMEPALFEALVNVYLEGAAGFLTKDEVELLPFSGKLITYENGLRFLTDYLAGDTYFKTHREHHNLDRCRTQFRLVESIESQFDQMASYVQKRWAETVGL